MSYIAAANLRRMLEQYNPDSAEIHFQYSNDFRCHVVRDNTIIYIPSPTSLDFHKSKLRWRFVMGGFNSGKSTACCHEILFKSCQMPKMQDGVRRSKWIIVRNTHGELISTTLQTWLFWFSRLGNVKRHVNPILTYDYSFNDKSGPIEMSIMFLALDRESDCGKIDSLEITHAYLNEVRHIPHAIINRIDDRLGRFPHPNQCDTYQECLLADTNPPSTDHWIAKLEEKGMFYSYENKNGVHEKEYGNIFHQPPAIIKDEKGNWNENKDAENIEHIKDGYKYYFKMIPKGEEYVRVYAQGYYGTALDGRAVWKQYNDDIHSTKTIEIDENEPILLAWDYGLVCPACVAMQYSSGQLRVIKEFWLEYSSVTELAKNFVIPWLKTIGKSSAYEAVGDPANTYRGREQLEKCNIIVINALTNNIGTRLESVTEFMTKIVDKNPALLMSRIGCPKLRQALLGKYNYKRYQSSGGEKYKDLPDKTHPYSDLADCMQYGAMHFSSNLRVAKNNYDYSKFINKERF